MSPSRAAERMASCGSLAAIVSMLVYGVLLASTIVGLAFFGGTMPYDKSTDSVLTRSLTRVWNDWHVNTHFGPGEITFCAVLAGVPILVAICAWTYLPAVHRTGSIRRSYFRAVSAVAACILVLTVTSFWVGMVAILSSDGRWLVFFGISGATDGTWGIFGPLAISLGICVVLWTVGRAVRGVQDERGAVRIGPRCEECGYDLTHVGRDHRCPECGTDVELCLAPNRRRPGCVWEERGGLADWLVTSAAVLVGPKRFYLRLKLRSPVSGPEAFGAWHLVGIGAATGIWGFFLVLTDPQNRDPGVLLLVPLILAFSVSCLAWGMRRLVAAIAGSWLLHTGAVVDFGWVGRIVQYESVYLWLFCAFNGLIFTFVVTMSGPAGVVFSVRGFYWIPLGPAVLLFGNIGLGLIWLWRYRIASRAVRWSNF